MRKQSDRQRSLSAWNEVNAQVGRHMRLDRKKKRMNMRNEWKENRKQ